MYFTWFSTSDFQGRARWDFFGYLCQYACHCQYGAACHSVTGECFEDCEFGWSGKPTCQIRRSSLSETLFKNHIENLIKIFFYT